MLVTAWEEVPREHIVRFYKAAGVLCDIDGRDDEHIVAFKPGHSLYNFKQKLKNYRGATEAVDAMSVNVSNMVADVQDDDYDSDASDIVVIETA